MIQDQIKLPAKVAFGVAMRGIRIRFGRSVVTIMGVVLGIAFLMSILTGQALRRGVEEEDTVRSEVNRMYSFLTAEMGPPRERGIGVILTANPDDKELRVIKQLDKNELGWIKWTGAADKFPVDNLKAEISMEKPGGIMKGASALLIIGDGPLPANINWDTLMKEARQKVIAMGARRDSIKVGESVAVVQLERELREDELKKIEAERRKEKFRNTWIVIISLLVTVIGISNSMLMSVTERFREIGTMKCLGALSGFIRTLFLIESGFVGIVGGFLGCVFGMLFSIVAYGITYGFILVSLSVKTEFPTLMVYFISSLFAGIVLSMIAALYPARVASKMIPANALRSNV